MFSKLCGNGWCVDLGILMLWTRVRRLHPEAQTLCLPGPGSTIRWFPHTISIRNPGQSQGLPLPEATHREFAVALRVPTAAGGTAANELAELRRTVGCWSGDGQIGQKPVFRQLRHVLERARLLKQMGSAGDDHQLCFRAHAGHRFFV